MSHIPGYRSATVEITLDFEDADNLGFALSDLEVQFVTYGDWDWEKSSLRVWGYVPGKGKGEFKWVRPPAFLKTEIEHRIQHDYWDRGPITQARYDALSEAA